MGRVIKVKMNHSKRKLALIAQDKQRTMFTRLVIAFVLVVAFASALAFGPVWLVADATRMQQETAELKRVIDDELTVNQRLMIDVAVMKSSDRLLRVATTDLGMVEPAAAKTWISLDEPTLSEADRIEPPANSWLGRVASLAVGEASALLVGDVSISALR